MHIQLKPDEADDLRAEARTSPDGMDVVAAAALAHALEVIRSGSRVAYLGRSIRARWVTHRSLPLAIDDGEALRDDFIVLAVPSTGKVSVDLVGGLSAEEFETRAFPHATGRAVPQVRLHRWPDLLERLDPAWVPPTTKPIVLPCYPLPEIGPNRVRFEDAPAVREAPPPAPEPPSTPAKAEPPKPKPKRKAKPRTLRNQLQRSRYNLSPHVSKHQDEQFPLVCARCGWACNHLVPVYWDSPWNAYGGICSQCCIEASIAFDIDGWPPDPAEAAAEAARVAAMGPEPAVEPLFEPPAPLPPEKIPQGRSRAGAAKKTARRKR